MAAEAEQRPLGLLHRSVAAAGASVVSAFVVNPLDVVKTRIQAQGAMGLDKQSLVRSETLLEKWNFAACECLRVEPRRSEACGPACTTPAAARPPLSSAAAAQPPGGQLYRGTLDGLRKIAQREGLRVLWRGTDVALMMAIPMVGIYLPLYDYLLERLQQQHPSPAAPLLAGTLARTAAVYCTAPFELVRTRLQAHSHMAAAAPAAVAADAARSGSGRAALLLQHMPPVNGNGGRLRAAGRMWTGVGATLARDVPFSALYWGMVEPIRGALLPEHDQDASEWQVLTANITAGAVAGGLAGAITTPFDVLKTRTQLQAGTGAGHPLLSSLRTIAAQEGVQALFRGWSARSAKAAPACAIVLSAYEVIKHLY